MRVEFRQDSKHQLMRRSISSYQSFDTHIAYRLDIHAQELVISYYWTDRTIIYWKICKTISSAVISLEIILSSAIHLWCHVSYILITIIIIRLASLVYSKQLNVLNDWTCYVIRIRSESEIDSTRIWTKSNTTRKSLNKQQIIEFEESTAYS